MHIHFVTKAQIETLKETFAVLTPEGWAIPEWVVILDPENEIATGDSHVQNS